MPECGVRFTAWEQTCSRSFRAFHRAGAMTKNVVSILSVATGIVAAIGLGRELAKVDDLGNMGHESLLIAACIFCAVGET